MTRDSYRRADCRLCKGARLELVVPFGATPIADDFVPAARLKEPQKTFSLDFYLCLDCGHLQLVEVVDPRLIFRADYAYESGASAGLVKHFGEIARSVLERAGPAQGRLAVDVGSNDGTLLKFFRDAGMKTLGVDPAERVARKAREAGIETLTEFFGAEAGRSIRERYGPAKVVTAANVFAHNDDMAGMAEGVRALLADDGVFAFEASYAVDVVDKMLLGSIFHEHVSYHTVAPMRAFLRRHGLELVDVERNPIQGGSIVGCARPAASKPAPSASVERLVAEERERGFDRPEVYRAFARRLEALRDEGRRLLQGFKDRGQRIAGFGAARGGTTLIYHFGLGDFLEYLVDDNPLMQGLYSPGLHLPVLPSSVIYERKPAALFLLAWVHAKPIMEKHKAYREQGGRFIVPFPKLEVL